MTQNYKPAYPPEFRQQMVALGKNPKQLSKEFGIDTSLVFSPNVCWNGSTLKRSGSSVHILQTYS